MPLQARLLFIGHHRNGAPTHNPPHSCHSAGRAPAACKTCSIAAMKHMLTIVSSLIIGSALALAACGGEKKAAAPDPAAAPAAAPATPAAATPAATTPSAAPAG